MSFPLSEIATALGAKLEGDGSIRIKSAAEPKDCAVDDLALCMDQKYVPGLSEGGARAAILWDGADWRALGLEAALFVPRPRYAMAHLTKVFDPGPQIPKGVHPSAVVDPTAEVGPDCRIGPFVVIGAGVRIGARARIAAHVSIGELTHIGDDALLHPGVRIGSGARIGDRVILHPGAALGNDGFAFVTPEKSSVENVRSSLGADGASEEQSWTRIHSLGLVEIGDDVEIGANSTVDRGTIRATRIGRGTKIDNLVQIGHNVVVGEDCLFCSLVGVAGSTRIGNRVVLAGQVGVNDNITIGDDVVAGGASKIFTKVPAGRVILGYPAMKMTTHVETYKALRRLPRALRELAELKKAVLNREQSD